MLLQPMLSLDPVSSPLGTCETFQVLLQKATAVGTEGLASVSRVVVRESDEKP